MTGFRTDLDLLNGADPFLYEIGAAVRRLFPSVWQGRGWAPEEPRTSDHGSKLASDLIITHRVGVRPTKAQLEVGWALAKRFVKYADDLGVRAVIFDGQIWTSRTGRWREYWGKGGVSIEHRDHVHLLLWAGRRRSLRRFLEGVELVEGGDDMAWTEQDWQRLAKIVEANSIGATYNGVRFDAKANEGASDAEAARVYSLSALGRLERVELMLAALCKKVGVEFDTNGNT